MPNYHVNMNAYAQNRLALGSHAYCGSAVAAAKHHYPRPNGCYRCCSACHTG